MAFSPPRFSFRADDDFEQGEESPEAGAGGGASGPVKSVSAPSVRVSMSRVVAGWGFGAAFVNITSGAVYTAFARALGANDFAFGVLAAALPAMSFLQVIAAKLVEHSGKRKRQVLIAGLIGRGLWTLAAVLPLLAEYYPGLIPKKDVLNFVIGCILLAGAFQAFSSPAFMSWMTDLVPSRVRPSFFARRMQFGTWVALLMTVASGLVADTYPDLRVYCALLGLAGVCGMFEILVLMRVHEPQFGQAAEGIPVKRKSPSLFATVMEPLRDPPIRRFLLFISLLMISYGFQGPFLWLYALEYLELPKTLTGLLLAGVPLVSIACTTRFWGDVLRRYGNRPVIRFASMVIALSSIGWVIARPGAWDLMPIILILTGSMAGAIELANLNLVTGLSSHVPRSSVAAMLSIAAGVSFAIAAWVAGALAQSLVWINTSDHDWFGMQLVNYHMLFLISLGLRLINATFIAPLLQEPESAGTIDAVKEIVPELAQSFAARFTRPLGARND